MNKIIIFFIITSILFGIFTFFISYDEGSCSVGLESLVIDYGSGFNSLIKKVTPSSYSDGCMEKIRMADGSTFCVPLERGCSVPGATIPIDIIIIVIIFIIIYLVRKNFEKKKIK